MRHSAGTRASTEGTDLSFFLQDPQQACSACPRDSDNHPPAKVPAFSRAEKTFAVGVRAGEGSLKRRRTIRSRKRDGKEAQLILIRGRRPEARATGGVHRSANDFLPVAAPRR